MTVTYTSEVATCRGFSCFLKLLARWRGSIYKLVWLDLLIFLSLYFGINLIYRFALNDYGRGIFENIVHFCKAHNDFIPLSFILGFYVSLVMTRWWKQYNAIPLPDALAVYVSATIHGHDERGRVMRRTIMRYVCLCLTMLFTRICPRVKKRFPTLDHLVEAGLLQPCEKEIVAKLNEKFPNYPKNWLPIVWAASIITRARKEGRVRDDFAVKTMIDELNKFRGQCGLLTRYDNISIPLVYTQVVTLAVYSYFLTALMGHQYTEGNKYKFDLYFPVFTMLQFFFYVGWLKVAETLINPFGDDDDDFEVNWMVDRNLQVSYLIVDEMHHEHPELVKDQYWDEIFPQELPYTAESRPFKDSQPLPSTANIVVPSATRLSNHPSYSRLISHDYEPDHEQPITFNVRSRRNTMASGSNFGLDSISRANSVANIIRRLFNRENSRNDQVINDSTQELNLINSIKKQPPDDRVKKIIDQIIEEVDEQMTLQARRETLQDTKPHMKDIFPETVADNTLLTPNRTRLRTRSDTSSIDQYSPLQSPTDEKLIDSISFSGSDSDHVTEFTQLKKKREEERTNRFTRSVSNIQQKEES